MKYKFLIIVLAFSFMAAGCNKSDEQTNQTTPPPAPPTAESPSPAPTTPTPTTPVTPPTSPKPTPTPPTIPPVTPNPTTPPPSSGATKNFTVTANDNAATPSMITVNKGDKVNLTIKLGTENVYQFGLDFRSSVINSGTIQPGASKTITFTANNTFMMEAYWPASQVKKAAFIHVMVE
jgi:hypothetical protein